MSVWTTKASGISRDFIVMQHTLKGVNYIVNGIKFRDSYAVVERNSKTHHMLKRIPVLRAAKEYPLLHLDKLSFITRPSDVKMVYGQEVYSHYLIAKDILASDQQILEQAEKLEAERKFIEQREKALQDLVRVTEEAGGDLEKIQEVKEQNPVFNLCCYRREGGELCKDEAYEASPSNYCHQHLFEDPRLVEFGIEKPKFMTKDETKKFREKAKNILEKAKKQGKF